VDRQGIIWVVWSSYDGDDYELFLSRRDGTGWHEEMRLTDNRLHDGFPSLASAGDALVVSWTRTLENGSQVLSMVTQEGQPGREIVLPPEPRIALSGRTACRWRKGLCLLENRARCPSQGIRPRFQRTGRNISPIDTGSPVDF
jgi:hypothetical protein